MPDWLCNFSLAGAKMLQRYRTNISGSSRKGSLHRLESLFLIDEDDKEDPDEDNLEVEEQVQLTANTRITGVD